MCKMRQNKVPGTSHSSKVHLRRTEVSLAAKQKTMKFVNTDLKEKTCREIQGYVILFNIARMAHKFTWHDREQQEMSHEEQYTQ